MMMKVAAPMLARLGRDDLSKPSRTMSGCAERARRIALPAHAATRPSVQSPPLNHARKNWQKFSQGFQPRRAIMKAKNEARVRTLVEACNECFISNLPLPTPDQVVNALNAVEAGRDIDDDMAKYIPVTFDAAERAGCPWRIRPAEIVRERMRSKMIIRPVSFADGTH
jgi:hypothetical protein